MTIFSGKRSSGSVNQSFPAPSQLLDEIDFLSDWQFQVSFDSDLESFHENLHKDLLRNSKNVGFLEPGSSLGAHGDIADVSPPRVEDNNLSLLHSRKEPYCPSRLFEADRNDCKHEMWVSPECLSKSEGQKQNWIRDFPEVTREGQKEAVQDKQKQNSNERDKIIEINMPPEVSENDEIINSLVPEHSDRTASTKSPAICCSEFAHQFPATEEKPACGISCTKGSEYIAHGVSNELATKVRESLKSAAEESDDRSILARSETNTHGLFKQPRIRYTRAFLVSLANLSIGKGLPRGIEQSVLCELDFRLDGPLQSSYDSDSESCHDNVPKGLLSSENVGLLGHGSLLGVNGDIDDASSPKVEENSLSLLHKSEKPYRPPRLFKADWNDKDKIWESPECLSKCQGRKQNWRRDFPEVTREGQKKAFQEKEKKNSNEHDENVKVIMPQEVSEYDEIIDSLAHEINDSLAPVHSDNTANHTQSPAICCSEFVHQFPALEQKPVYPISCTKGSESVAHGMSNQHFTKVPDEHLKSTTDETSEQVYGCKAPAVNLGVLACVDLEHILKPDTKEISCSMLWDGCDAEDGKQYSGSHHGSHHLLLLPDKGTEQNHMTASSKLNIASDELHPGDSITDNNKLKFLSQGNAGQCEKNLTREPSYGASYTTGLQWTDASSCIRQSSVGRSRRKSDSKICKFFFPVADKSHLASAISKYKPSVINSQDVMFSSSTDQSKGRENLSVSDDLKLDLVCCSDEKYWNIGIKDDKSTHVYKTEAPDHQGKTPYRASPALINSQFRAINPKFKSQYTSNRAFSTNMLPTTFHQSEAKSHQQLHQTHFSGKKKRIRHGASRLLRTKGTTAVFFFTRDHFLACVDSREHLQTADYKYISSELLRKYRVFWDRIVVVFIGDVCIGKAVLKYLQSTVPTDRELTIDELGLLAYEFHPTTEGICDVYLGGLSDSGEPRLLYLLISNDRRSPKMKQDLKPCMQKNKFASGSGKKVAGDHLKLCNKNSTIDEVKRVVASAMVIASVTNEDTGGFINTVHVYVDDEQRIRCDTTKKKTVNCMVEFYDYCEKDTILYVFYDRREQDQQYFLNWIRSTKPRSGDTAIKLGSPIAKVKKQRLVFGSIRFESENLANNALGFGKNNCSLLKGMDLREIEYDKKIFFLAKPSVDFLRLLDVKRIDEYNLIPKEEKEGKEEVDECDDLTDSDDDDDDDDDDDELTMVMV